MNFSVDKDNKKIVVDRGFAAPVDKVWKAWTDSEILDKWWAPKPWRSETKSMEFKEGGTWLYAMVGPEEEKHWARFDYDKIDPVKSYTGRDAFCDEQGNINKDFGRVEWTNNFSEEDGKTNVHVTLSFERLEDIDRI
jgi:uncharacterized protein YndB with AHSA1/START domain